MACPESSIRAVAEDLIAAINDGQRTPQDVLSGVADLPSWRPARFRLLLTELSDANRAGRLNGCNFDRLHRIIEQRLLSTPGDDTDTTVELETSPLSAAAVGPASHASLPATEVEIHSGTILRDRYVLGDPVARGGMSIVFRARDLRRESSADESPEVAVKVLRDHLRASKPAIARLRREFRQTQALRHPGVVRMFDLDCDRDLWFITMELLDGVSLESRLKGSLARPLDAAEAMRIASACADALDCAHQQGVVHGDFKPGNVFLEGNGGIRLLDFGVAPERSTEATEAAPEDHFASPAVTLAYASPEVLAGDPAQPRDDVFSFACVVYELLSGQHPFARIPADEARDASLAAKPLPQLSTAQNEALASGLAWTRTERPATVRELMRSLLHYDAAVETVSTASPATSSPWPSRLPWRWLGALAAAVLLIAAWQLRFTDGGDNAAPVVAKAPAIPEVAEIVAAPVEPKPAVAAIGGQPKVETRNASAPSTGKAPPATRTAPAAARKKVQIGADSASIVTSEKARAAVILLRRTGDLNVAAQVTWRLSDGTARAHVDFDGSMTGTARFLRGQITRAVYVPLINDAEREGAESFSLSLTSDTATIGPIGRVTITILDDD